MLNFDVNDMGYRRIFYSRDGSSRAEVYICLERKCNVRLVTGFSLLRGGYHIHLEENALKYAEADKPGRMTFS
jgi:hypothetical protein